jgi:lysophospholipase L1-like esterase
MRTFPLHTALAILTTGLLMAGVRLVQPAFPAPHVRQLASLVDLPPGNSPLLPIVRHREPEPPPIPRARIAAPQPLLVDRDGVLDRFYAALWRTEKKESGAVTRIDHYGDSPTTADLITGDIRGLLQKQFGSAGHGFLLAAQPWAWYQHTGVDLAASGWKNSAASRVDMNDGMFGLGGVSFLGGPGARSRIRLKESGHSRIEIWYLKQPEGGVLTVSADGKKLGAIETAAEAKEPAFELFPVEGGAQEIELEVERGTVRLFGVSMERAGPGVVYDSLGLNGASITVLSRMFGEKHWTRELQHRNANLVVINYGTNEADFDSFVDKQLEKELREAVRRVRAALPEAAILLMSPMDRGYRAESKEIETMPTIPRIVATQRRVAAETGCGFFDTFAAMGGAGTMARWYAAQPRLVSADFIHPYPAGGKMIATVFAKEIEKGLNRYKVRQVDAVVH